MKFEIYHQAGFRHQWNLQSINDDRTGDGIIIGARSLEKEKVESLPAKVRRKAIFDPQFFLPAVPKGKLATYDFFPHIAADGSRLPIMPMSPPESAQLVALTSRPGMSSGTW